MIGLSSGTISLLKLAPLIALGLFQCSDRDRSVFGAAIMIFTDQLNQHRNTTMNKQPECLLKQSAKASSFSSVHRIINASASADAQGLSLIDRTLNMPHHYCFRNQSIALRPA